MMTGLALTGCMQPNSAKQERPEYTVTSAGKEFEIRDYGPQVMAEISLRGTYRRSVEQGYIQLERYFLGENLVPEAMKITPPIMVREDIAGGWQTIFLLPAGSRVETAPRPNDERIRVVEFPNRRIAAVKFPGKLNEVVMREQAARLDAWLMARDIGHRGDFTLAGYDPPWISAERRKNEVMVTLK